MKRKIIPILLASILITTASRCWARPLPTPAWTRANIIRAIIGEAADQGKRGMLAVACAIRNRKTLKGVVGFYAKQVNKEPEWVWKQAAQAWAKSAHVDIVDGASYWEDVRKFGMPAWAKHMHRTVQIKDHVFFRK